MELGQVKAFLVLAEELHFGRAAARLHVSQPPLSRQIRQLEEEIGVELFERTSRSVRITPAGDAFRREAKEMLARKDAAVSAARNAAAQNAGSVDIGFVGASTYSFLPRLAEMLNDRLPWLTMRFHEATSVAQMEALMLDRLDIGLMRPVDGVETFESITVLRETLAVAMPIGHRLAKHRRFEIALLDNEPIIGFSPEAPYLRGLLSDVFRQGRVCPRIVQEFAQSQAVLSLVSAGFGLAVLPAGTANASFDNVAFRPLRIDDRREKDYGVELLAVWKAETRNAARLSVIELLTTFGS